MDAIIDDGIIQFNPDCVRKTSNWSKPDASLRFDNNKFNKAEVLRLIPTHSPKMASLLKHIEALDKRDMEKHGRLYKHFIFSDVKSSQHGPKMIASSLIAKGWTLAYDSKLNVREANRLLETKYKNFLFLSSVAIYDKEVSTKMKKSVLELFNRRPDNVGGELARIIIMDSGYKEGIDLFDIKYVHLFEPSLNGADQKQAIGRGTRTCGQKGLRFSEKSGWPLYVYIYDLSFPPEFQSTFLDTKTAIDLYLKANHFDFRLLRFAHEIERLAVLGSVDYELNKEVHQFAIDVDEDDKLQNVYGGGRKREVSVYKNIYTEDANLANIYGHKRTANYVKELEDKLTRDGQIIRWAPVKMENQCGPPPEKRGGGNTQIINHTPTQNFIRHYFTPECPVKGMLLYHSVGTGKCHAWNTPILMYDGTVKMVQDVQVGDALMGDDSTPRKVLSLARGQDEMYRVQSNHGQDYTVNSEHILCLKEDESVTEMTILDYMSLPIEKQQQLKGYRVGVDFSYRPVFREPYYVGYTLGKSTTAIPPEYKINHSSVLLEVLAGIIDSIGRVVDHTYEIKIQHLSLAKDIEFICRVLGLGVDVWKIDQGYACCIYGNPIVPVRNPLYRLSPIYDENILLSNIQVTSVGYGDYYGFTLDGNCRYLMGDFTVTHNTCTAIAAATTSFEPEGYTILWVTRTTLKNDIWKNMFDLVCHEGVAKQLRNGLSMPDDQDKRMRLLGPSWRIRPMSYKQFSNLVEKKNQLYEDLVKINGPTDPLRKTLLIIDEAHKLYGGGDLSSIERPDMKKLHKALMKSYEISRDNSVRLLLMTATPITEDPMELIKLINLCRPPQDQMPDDFYQFSKAFLNSEGTFSPQNEKKFLDDIAGYISYLNREKDARVFSQPQITHVLVPVATEDTAKALDDPDRLVSSKDLMAQMKVVKTQLKAAEDKFKQDTSKSYLKSLFDDLIVTSDAKIKKASEQIVAKNVDLLAKDLDALKHETTRSIQDQLNELEGRLTRKRSAAKKGKSSDAIGESVLGMLRDKCAVKVKKTQKTKESTKKTSRHAHTTKRKPSALSVIREDEDEGMSGGNGSNLYDVPVDAFTYDERYFEKALDNHANLISYDQKIKHLNNEMEKIMAQKSIDIEVHERKLDQYKRYLEMSIFSDAEKSEFQKKITNFKEETKAFYDEVEEKYKKKTDQIRYDIERTMEARAKKIVVLREAIRERIKKEQEAEEELRRKKQQMEEDARKAAATLVKPPSSRHSIRQSPNGLRNRGEFQERVEYYRNQIQSQIQEILNDHENKQQQKQDAEQQKAMAKQAAAQQKEEAKRAAQQQKEMEKAAKEEAKRAAQLEKAAAKQQKELEKAEKKTRRKPEVLGGRGRRKTRRNGRRHH